MATETITVTAPDISCEHCQNTITKALTPIEGVRSVNVEIPAKRVTVDFDDGAIGVDRMKAILAEEDYPVESVVDAS